MALINCPECGNQVSDRAHQCPNCGYPIENIKVVHEIKEEVVQMDVEKVNVEQQKKGKMKKVLFVLLLLIVILIAVVVVCSLGIFNKELVVNSIEMSKWKVIDAGSYGDDYEAAVVSDVTKPYVAVIGSYEDKDMIPQFVYMEDGKGTYATYESNDVDPSVKYTVIGYMDGQVIKDSDISNIKCTDSEYEDSEYSESTSCNVCIDVELKSKKSGLLFLELSNDMTNEIKHNFFITVIDGRGQYDYYLSDLPIKSRGVEVVATPKMFCPIEDLKDTDYSIEKAFSVEKDEGKYTTSYSGTEELGFKDFKDGYVIYTKELKEGGNKEKRGKIIHTISYLHNNECIISTYDWGDVDEKMLTPQYEINVIGYLTWTELEKEI